MGSLESKIYGFIEDNNIATSEEINLVTSVAGYTVETLNAIIYARTGYHDEEQCLTCEPDNYHDVNGDFSEEEEEEEI